MGTDNTSSADKQGNLSASNHPEYDEYSTDWQQMRDTFNGERIVKEAGTLPISRRPQAWKPMAPPGTPLTRLISSAPCSTTS